MSKTRHNQWPTLQPPKTRQRSAGYRAVRMGARVGAAGAALTGLGIGLNALANRGEGGPTVPAVITFGEGSNPSDAVEAIEGATKESYSPGLLSYNIANAELAQHSGPGYLDMAGNPITQPGESIKIDVPKTIDYPRTIYFPSHEMPLVTVSFPQAKKQ